MAQTESNAIPSEYYLVVDRSPQIRAEWAKAFEGTGIEAYITGSISDALVKWSAWFINGCVPRSVIVDWGMRESTEICMKRGQEVAYCHADGVSRRGAQYLLHYCIDLSPEGIFVVYTSSPREVGRALSQDPVVGPHTMIANKGRYLTQDVLNMIRENPVFINQTSGFYNVGSKFKH